MQFRKIVLILSGLLILSACKTFPGAASTPTATFPFIPTTAVPGRATPELTPLPPSPLDFDKLLALFDYDGSLPLDVEILESDLELNVLVETLRYTGGQGFEVPAYMVIPVSEGPFPAVIYLHMGGGNRDQFLVEAIALADMGIASLLIDSPFVGAPWGGEEIRPDFPADMREGVIRQVLDVRRGLDLLAGMPDQIDMGRIALVGHSSGASFGGIVAGVEERIGAYVLMDGNPRFSETIVSDGGELPRMDDLDAVHYIRHAAPASVLFQFAEDDEVVDLPTAELYFNAASQPKAWAWYEANHRSLEWISRLDRLKWLSAQLGVDYILEN